MPAVKALAFSGESGLRHRIVLSLIAQQPLRISGIRPDDDHPGLAEHEMSFLRLVEKLTNGTTIEIGHTGTSLRIRPGVISGGAVEHECHVARGIGYYLEPLIPLAIFSKHPFVLTLHGVTNDNFDPSVDLLRTAVLPVLRHFGVDDAPAVKIAARGARPAGGGRVEVRLPHVRQLRPAELVDERPIRRIRGIAYATRVSPQLANRAVDGCRKLLTPYIPDVYIHTDVFKGAESGKSPGYGVVLVAESGHGTVLATEIAFEPRQGDVETPSALQENWACETPEELGQLAAYSLLGAIDAGGCVSPCAQWLVCLLMLLGPEDVSRVRLGALTPFAVAFLRDLHVVFGSKFSLEPDRSAAAGKDGVLVTGVGIGYLNVNKSAA